MRSPAQDLRDDERVRAQLNAALNAMNAGPSPAAQPAQPQPAYGGAAGVAPPPNEATNGAAAGTRLLPILCCVLVDMQQLNYAAQLLEGQIASVLERANLKRMID